VTTTPPNQIVAYADPNIRGEMKPFQSELYFKPKGAGADYQVILPTWNYVASLAEVSSSCSIKEWNGVVIGQPCWNGGSANKVMTGYGIHIETLDDSSHTLVASNAAAIKIDGLNEYGRILWNGSSIYEVASGELRIQATELGFYDAAPVSKPSVTGSKGGNAALASLLSALDSLGLIDDNTT
jgi:hypothetical protein